MTLIDKTKAHDDDLIRRGDALAALQAAYDDSAFDPDLADADARIAALPAVTVGVRGHMLRSLLAKAVDDLSVGMEVDLIALERSVLAALDLTPAPDAPAEDTTAKGETCGQMLDRLGADGAKWAAEFRTTALRLGYSDMDEGWLIGWFCNAIMAGHDRQPTPHAAAIREATARLHKLAYWLDTDAEVLADMDQRDLSDHQHIQAEVNAILALIQKGGA